MRLQVDLLDEVEKGFDAVKKGLFWSIMDKVRRSAPLVGERQRYDEGKGGAGALTASAPGVGSGAVTVGE
jgi:hypothetical protein